MSTAASYGSTARSSWTAAARPAQHVLLIPVDGLHQSDHPSDLQAVRAQGTPVLPDQ
jgi:hypothetical protein